MLGEVSYLASYAVHIWMRGFLHKNQFIPAINFAEGSRKTRSMELLGSWMCYEKNLLKKCVTWLFVVDLGNFSISYFCEISLIS